MKWKSRIPVELLLGVVAMTALQFFGLWAGYGNMPGPDPRGWGDPLPLSRVVEQLPVMLAASVIGVILLTLPSSTSGVTPDASLAHMRTRTGTHLSKTAPCPNCGVAITERVDFELFECPSCTQPLRFSPGSHVHRTAAAIIGAITAVLSGQRGIGFLLIWVMTATILAAWLQMFRRPQLRLGMPREFHRELGHGGAN